jgi:hypothetical protein
MRRVGGEIMEKKKESYDENDAFFFLYIGKKEGQIKMIRVGDLVEAYQVYEKESARIMLYRAFEK